MQKIQFTISKSYPLNGLETRLILYKMIDLFNSLVDNEVSEFFKHNREIKDILNKLSNFRSNEKIKQKKPIFFYNSIEKFNEISAIENRIMISEIVCIFTYFKIGMLKEYLKLNPEINQILQKFIKINKEINK